jgi:carotenoid 1,2-hydratase
VFSPWYRLARRRGGGDPARHCALNVALYGRGGKRWAMTERGAHALSRGADYLAIGPSGLGWDGRVLTIDIDEMTVPWPSRIRGQVRLHPASLATHEVMLDGVGQHRWQPVAPAARVEVDLRQPALRWSGTAYFDTNAGSAPLEEGFTFWHWCRAGLRHGTAVLYHGERIDGTPFCTALRYAPDGSAEAFDPPPPAGLPRSFWRLPRATRAEAGFAPRITQVLEDAPFYARSVLASRVLGEDVTAVHESLSLTRFVQPWVQVMLPFKAPRALS